jgi:hypothetical protein
MNGDLQRRLGSIEELLHKVDSAADPSLRANVHELVELVMALHGAGLEKMLELIQAAGSPGEAVLHRLLGDDLIASLLVLHGIHPMTLEDRVMDALDKLRSRGVGVELIGVQDGAVRVRLTTKPHLKETVEAAIHSAAPDLTTLTIESAEEKQGFVPLEMLVNSQPVPVRKGGL